MLPAARSPTNNPAAQPFDEDAVADLPSADQPAQASSSGTSEPARCVLARFTPPTPTQPHDDVFVRPDDAVTFNQIIPSVPLPTLGLIFSRALQPTLKIYRNSSDQTNTLNKLNDTFQAALDENDKVRVQSSFFQVVALALLKQNGRAKKNTEAVMEDFKTVCGTIEKKK